MQHLCSSPWRVCSELMADGAVDTFIHNIYYSKVTACFTALYAPALKPAGRAFILLLCLDLFPPVSKSTINHLTALFSSSLYNHTHLFASHLVWKQRSSSESGFGILTHNRKTTIKRGGYKILKVLSAEEGLHNLHESDWTPHKGSFTWPVSNVMLPAHLIWFLGFTGTCKATNSF